MIATPVESVGYVSSSKVGKWSDGVELSSTADTVEERVGLFPRSDKNVTIQGEIEVWSQYSDGAENLISHIRQGLKSGTLAPISLH